MNTFWLILGFTAQALFSARFIVQWIASEKAKESIIPSLFWYLSITGGGLLLIYAIHIKDPVFIIGQAFGFLIYGRNIYFVIKKKRMKIVEQAAP
ncbi:MAG TPA: lipid A biosynthesis protein [Lentisphaeria bacterium]|nr:MAG: lipid A biosynthesis protein [Lentisphaerae bacterium GWF2_50_93]HCE46632.1 lipid A biosynthesis protein [Lentisphaeria bacterium]